MYVDAVNFRRRKGAPMYFLAGFTQKKVDNNEKQNRKDKLLCFYTECFRAFCFRAFIFGLFCWRERAFTCKGTRGVAPDNARNPYLNTRLERVHTYRYPIKKALFNATQDTKTPTIKSSDIKSPEQKVIKKYSMGPYQSPGIKLP